jgi:hypothetical protein
LRRRQCLLRCGASGGKALYLRCAGSLGRRVRARLIQKYPDATTIPLVVDNLNIHHRKSRTDYYGETAGNWIWELHDPTFTPTHGSWLHQAEIEISLFARPCLGKKRIPDLKMLQQETRAWNRRMNRGRVTINWRFDRKAAHRKFGYKKYTFKRSETRRLLNA